MLMQRVLTAAVLIPLLLAAIWFLPDLWLYQVFAAVGLLIAVEWTALMKLQRPGRLAYLLLIALLLSLGWRLQSYWLWMGLASLAWWGCALVLVRGYPGNFAGRALPTPLMALIGVLLIVPTVVSLSVLHAGGLGGGEHVGALRLLYVFFLIFAADTGAYFAGRRFGRRKLAPAVSPGKSVEGAIGGLALSGVWAATAGLAIFEPAGAKLPLFLLLSLFVAMVSILGDLTESLFKRVAGVKDSGNILPGHGGILDRTDSLLAAAPLMALGLRLLGL